MMNKITSKQNIKVLGFILLYVLTVTTAQAAGFNIDDSGTKANNFIGSLIKWAVIIAGSVGTLILLFKFIQAWTDRLDWMDFFKFGVFYALSGGVVAIAAVIFSAFK